MDTEEQKIINEEYKIWRKNVPFLYDFMLTHSLYWPTLTVQFFPDAVRNEERGTTSQRLLLSTHTSGSDTEYILIASVTFVDEITESVQYEMEGSSKIKIVQKIAVSHEVNRARYAPNMCNVIAARSDSADVHVYDYTRHLNESENGPDMVLKGHSGGGYGISWSPNDMEIVTGGEDKVLCLFDVSGKEKVVHAKNVFAGHTAVINDCSYGPTGLIGSCGDDRKLILWDSRTNEAVKILESAHASDIHSLTFNQKDQNLIATGSADGSVKIWDTRNLKPLATLLQHKKAIMQLEWSPHYSSILASSSADRRVCIWDTSKVGQVANDEYPPELLFLHAGHTNNVCDISWNPLEPFEIASVAEDNVLQIWQMSKKK
ncbi:Histone acetyltransferase type B subunit 2 [Dictyocoela roeselum]|nr:Histone acetyltransferase type B subunit 2 [Dictyocoela roeselum]